MATKQAAPAASLPPPKPIPVKDLFLDCLNPRLAGMDLSINDQDEILEILWRERAVNELVDSIATSGYWEHEELFAAKEQGKLVAIEGNRRLAAVKLLLDENLRTKIGASGVPDLPAEAKEQLRKLPVIECTREEVWQYIGFKHVNGPQDWDSIAKAQYIARVRNEYDIPLDEIARTIGDRHDTVKRLYRGLMVLNQAEQNGVFSRDDRFNSRFAYSHLWTGLGYSGVQEFLGLSSEKGFKPNPVPRNKLDNLGELCLWLYGSKEQDRKPLIRSQNPDLRNLDEVLRSRDGLAALRNGLPLETSLNVSRGDKRRLIEAMVMAEQKLKEAKGLVSTGYEGDSELYRKVEAINIIARSLEKEMGEIIEAKGASTPATKRRGAS